MNDLEFYGKCENGRCRQPGYNAVLVEESDEVIRLCDSHFEGTHYKEEDND